MDNPLADDLDFILSQTKDLWEELRGKRIFITGGTGFFGCWLLESFCWANEKLGLKSKATVLTRSIKAFQKKAAHLANNSCIELLEGDICSFAFPKKAFSHCIHAFGHTSDALQKPGAGDTLDIVDKTLGGLRRTLDFCINRKVGKILFISTGAVYGAPTPGMTRIPEDFSCGADPSDVKNGYHEIRRMAEAICAAYAGHFLLDLKIARGFTFVGPYIPLNGQFAVGNFINDGLRGGPIMIKGNGAPARSYLYMSDLAAWLWTILFRGRACTPYNVGSENGVSIRGLADAVSAFFSPRVGVTVCKEPLPGAAPSCYIPDTSRAKRELGLEETVPLNKALEKTIRWNRNNHL